MSNLKDMKYIKEDLERMIYIEKLSYETIGKYYGVSGTYIKKVAYNLGISLPGRKKFPIGWIPHNKGKKKIKNCINCNKECNFFSKKYCSLTCQQQYQSKKLLEKFLAGDEYFQRATYNPCKFKPYIIKEQNNKCAICGILNEWNNKPIIFIIDHIDGNAANNKRENLRCVCPNCDSQLPTFKSKNKNSARKERYLKNYKN